MLKTPINYAWSQNCRGRMHGSRGHLRVQVVTPRWRKLLPRIMGLHSMFTTKWDEVWLWHGQDDRSHDLLPGMHSRVQNTSGLALDERNVGWATTQLLGMARANKLDTVDGLRLPDIALLAHLQHHGAATPLLDVSVDPLVAVWMAVNASGSDSTANDDKSGVVFAIRKPSEPKWNSTLDSRPYRDTVHTDIATTVSSGVHWYRAPDISERLRIQRGSFLMGALTASGNPTTLDLKIKADKNWIDKRIGNLGKPGKVYEPSTDVVAPVRFGKVLSPNSETGCETRPVLLKRLFIRLHGTGRFSKSFVEATDGHGPFHTPEGQ